MWLLISGSVLLLFAAAVLYLIRCVSQLEFMQIICKGKKRLGWLTGALCIFALYMGLTICINNVNAIIVLLHFCVIWIIVNLIMYILKHVSAKVFPEFPRQDSKLASRIITKRWMHALLALVITAVYLTIGAYNAMHVVKTTYEINTEKKVGQLRIALISDSHISTLFDGDGFAEYVKEIQSEKPDLVIIAGDYVDDETYSNDMIKSCRALGKLECTYGVYYSPGNHDRGYYNNRDFSYDDLKNELEDNGVRVLEDEAVLIDERFYIIGRKDKSEQMLSGNRKSMSEWMSEIDASKYTIVVDHQPNDYKAQAESGVDLVLSGHTHGGQIIPGNFTGELFNLNDFTYGMKRIDNTDFIVTSGIADWKLMFKTGCKSEYVIVDINK